MFIKSSQSLFIQLCLQLLKYYFQIQSVKDMAMPFWTTILSTLLLLAAAKVTI